MARTGLQIRQGVGLPGSENGSASGGSGTMNGALNGSQQTESQYTLPGVLHYLNQEHRRFETQRNYWEIERAKLKARLSQLEGENIALASLKDVQSKRISMLEVALKNERAHTDVPKESIKPTDHQHIVNTPITDIVQKGAIQKQEKIKQSRQLLHRCLEDMSNLISQHTNLTNIQPPSIPVSVQPASTAGGAPGTINQNSLNMPLHLHQTFSDTDLRREKMGNATQSQKTLYDAIDEDAEFDAGMTDLGYPTNSNNVKFSLSSTNTITHSPTRNSALPISSPLEDRADSTQYTWYVRNILQDHLASVRTAAFDDDACAKTGNVCVVTAGADSTIKYWRIPSNKPRHRSLQANLTPQYTLRGHSGLVSSIICRNEYIYSAGEDCIIRKWKKPAESRSMYDSGGETLMAHQKLIAHKDAIWDLKLNAIGTMVASAGSDGFVKLWDSGYLSLLRNWKYGGQGMASPTALEWSDSKQESLFTAWDNSVVEEFDLEYGQIVCSLQSADTYDGTPATQINCVVKHPSEPIIITAHEDRHIRFFDKNSGQCIYSMVAHVDSVASLAIAPDGRTLVSGGHDASIRFWDILQSRTCIQELTAHRPRRDEGVNKVIWSADGNYVGSAGGDGVAKVLVGTRT